jgi:hypothetical protein
MQNVTKVVPNAAASSGPRHNPKKRSQCQAGKEKPSKKAKKDEETEGEKEDEIN